MDFADRPRLRLLMSLSVAILQTGKKPENVWMLCVSAVVRQSVCPWKGRLAGETAWGKVPSQIRAETGEPCPCWACTWRLSPA